MDVGAFFRGWWRLRAQHASAAPMPLPTEHPQPSAATADGPGVRALPVDELLGAQHALIRRIKLAYGVDAATFADDILAVIRRYAAYVNRLPATSDQHFNEPGGLLRLGLETGFYALQATDGQIFSGRATITHRRQLEPRWRHATFIAGLCSELHRTLSHVVVTDGTGHAWAAYLGPLTACLQERQQDRFFVRWVADAQETRALAVYALPHIVPAALLQHLAQGNAVVVPHLLASISGMPVYRETNILDQLVKQAATRVIARDLHRRAERAGTPPSTSHLERHLVDALRRLVQTDAAWTPNAERSRVWYGQDGLFVVWPSAAIDIAAMLEQDNLPGMPTSAEAILAILVDAGIVAPRSASDTTWPIHPPPVKSALDAIKLASPAMLLAHLATVPPPLCCNLTEPKASSKPAAVRNATAPRASATPSALPGSTPDNEDTAIALAPHHPARSTPEHLPKRRRDQCEHDRPDGATNGAVGLHLRAPLRLQSELRAALTDIIDTLNDSDAPACWRTAAGLFIPLSELERRQIDPSMAIRALSGLSMLVVQDASDGKSAIHLDDAERRRGIVIASRYINNVRTLAVTVPPTGNLDADPQV